MTCDPGPEKLYFLAMDISWKNTMLVAFIALLATLSASSCSIHPIRSASTNTDFSGIVDFGAGELARLDGNWDFFPGRLIDPAQLPPVGGLSQATVKVPHFWAAVNGFSSMDPAVVGTATLRLRVVLPQEDTLWALRLPNASSALKVFVDGVSVAEIGRLAGEKSAYIPSNDIAYPEFHSSGGRMEIVLQIANYSAPYIGTWDAPLLGHVSAIREKRQGDVVSTSLISGALLIMGLYHLGLFLLRKKDRASLLFGIACILMTVRNLIMGERLLLALFPPGAVSWEWAFKLEHLSAHLTVPLFGFFFLELFPRQVRRIPVRIILAVGAAWFALTLLAPAMVYQRFLHTYEVFLLVAGLYILGSLMVALFRKEEGALLVFIGLACLMATVANDVFLSIGIISSTFFMASYGVFLYIFVQSFQLSRNFARAFSDIERLSNNLKEKNRELESLHNIDLAIASNLELDRILTIILEQAVKNLDIDAADILLLDPQEGALSLGSRLGFRTEALMHTKLKTGQGFAGKALQSDDAIFVSELDKHAEGFSRSPAFAGEGFIFYAGRRLSVKGKVVGVLELYRRRPLQSYVNWDLFFMTLAGQAAIALDNSALLQGLKRANAELAEANEAMIESWAEALELRDQETEGHSRRVTEAALELAQVFGIEGTALERVRHGALLHDIGKMGIPDSVLLKPGPLDASEFDIMKRHPTIARDLLCRLRFLEDSLDIPYAHHEKWDGSGYPRCLAGTDIPLSARIFAIIDVWDALRSDRPYRKSWPEERVLDHIASLAGSHFDPEVAKAFLDLRRGQVH